MGSIVSYFIKCSTSKETFIFTKDTKYLLITQNNYRKQLFPKTPQTISYKIVEKHFFRNDKLSFRSGLEYFEVEWMLILLKLHPVTAML